MTEIIDMTGDVENEIEEDPFEWWYEQSDNEYEYQWGEMSYWKFDRKTTWDDMEPNDFEIYLLEG